MARYQHITKSTGTSTRRQASSGQRSTARTGRIVLPMVRSAVAPNSASLPRLSPRGPLDGGTGALGKVRGGENAADVHETSSRETAFPSVVLSTIAESDRLIEISRRSICQIGITG
jgi:hypothetical protein